MRIAERAAAAAGAVLLARFPHGASVTENIGKDIKTMEDVEAENAAMTVLRREGGGAPILSEERGGDDQCRFDHGGLWILDPLDGTLNFTRGIPLCCVSVGYWRDGQPVAGAIFDFLRSEMFLAAVGTGAWCNGRPILVSSEERRDNAIIATGFPSGRAYDESSLLRFVQKVQQFKKVRLLGSAALSLAHVAAGHVDLYSEEDIYFWDVAAGLALVLAAGGEYEMSALTDKFRCDIVANNSKILTT